MRLQIIMVLYAYIVKYTREKILPPCRNDVPLVDFSVSNEPSNHQWEVVHYLKSIGYFCYFFLQISSDNNTTAGGTDAMEWWAGVQECNNVSWFIHHNLSLPCCPSRQQLWLYCIETAKWSLWWQLVILISSTIWLYMWMSGSQPAANTDLYCTTQHSDLIKTKTMSDRRLHHNQ